MDFGQTWGRIETTVFALHGLTQKTYSIYKKSPYHFVKDLLSKPV